MTWLIIYLLGIMYPLATLIYDQKSFEKWMLPLIFFWPMILGTLILTLIILAVYFLKSYTETLLAKFKFS